MGGADDAIDKSQTDEAFGKNIGGDDEGYHVFKDVAHAIPKHLQGVQQRFELAVSYAFKSNGHKQADEHHRGGIEHNGGGEEAE